MYGSAAGVMEQDTLMNLWQGLAWLGGGVLCHFLNKHLGREAERVERAKRVGNIKDLVWYVGKEGKPGTSPLVAVEGRANSDTPILCSNGLVKAVEMNQKVEQVFMKQVDGQWVKDSEVLDTKEYTTRWFLEDASGKAHVVGARNASGVSFTQLQPVLEDESSPLVRSIMKSMPGTRGLYLKTTQSILRVGQHLTVVGEVSLGMNNRVVLQRPRGGGPFYVSTRTLDQIAADARAWSMLCKWGSWGCSAVGAICMASVAVDAFQHWQKNRRANPSVPRARGGANPGSASVTGGVSSGRSEGEAASCVICQENQCRMVFVPCGHVCACEGCAVRVTTCPMCRRGIDQRLTVFLQ